MSDLTRWNLRGPVRTAATELIEWDSERAEWKPPRAQRVVTFDPEGAVQTLEQPGQDGTTARTSWSYDEAGRMTRVDFEAGGDRSTQVCEYDDRGRLVREEVRTEGTGERAPATVYSYTADGLRTSVRDVSHLKVDAFAVEGTETLYGGPGAATIATRYDAADQPAEVRFEDAAGRLIRRVVFVRDDAGRLVSEEMQPGASLPEFEPVLDAHGARERDAMASLLATVFRWKTIYSYDAQGRVSERTRLHGGLGEERTRFEYDERGNPIDEITVDSRREVGLDEEGHQSARADTVQHTHVHYTYTYDSHGNWTERVFSIRDGPDAPMVASNLERRRIAYFSD